MAWTKKDIVDYYRQNEFAYGLWGRNMHYGYWDRGTWTLRQATQKFNEVLAERARICDKDHVLDAGCGVGGSSIYLANRTGCRVTGVTICRRQVGLAYRNAKRAGVSHLTEFHEMDYQATTFKDRTFDVVWGLESICYAENKRAFVHEAYRVLKDDGRLIVADGFASRETYTEKESKILNRWLDGWIVNYLDTPAAFRRHAGEAGFQETDYRDVTANVLITSKLMFVVSLLFLPLHLLDLIHKLKPYPTDALFHQRRAMKRGLWEYGVFYAAK